MSSEMNLSLRVTADLNSAKQAIKSLSGDVNNLSGTVKNSDRQWQAVSESAERAARSTQSVMSAQVDAMNRGQAQIRQEERRQQAQEAATKGATKQKQETEKLTKELGNLLGSIDPVTRALSKLDAQEQKLRDLNKAGLLDNASFDGYLTRINQQRDGINMMTGRTEKLTINAKAARGELALLIRQLASGNLVGAGQNFLNLGNRVGVLPRLFSATGLAAAAAVGGVVAVGSAVVSVTNDQDRFARSLITTGNYAGVSSGQLEVMAQNAARLGDNYSTARDVLSGLASSGRFTGQALNEAGQAATLLAELTGQSADQVVGEFSRMGDSVSAWATNSDEKYHWLDVATLARIQALEKQGRQEEAVEVASIAFKDAMKGRLKELQGELNWLARGWLNVKNAAASASEGFKRGTASALGLDSDAERRASEIEAIERRLASAGSDTDIAQRGGVYAELVARDRERLAVLQDEVSAQEQLQAQAQERQRTENEAKKALTELSAQWDKNKSAIDKEADAVDVLRRQYAALWATEAGRNMLESRGVESDDGQNFSGAQWDADAGSLSESTRAAKQYNEQLERTLNTTGALTQLQRTEAEIRNGSLKDATQQEQDAARELARQIDARNASVKAARDAAQQTKKSTAENQRFVDSLIKQADKLELSGAALRRNQIDTRNLTDEQRRLAEAANAAINAQENQAQNVALRLQLMRAEGNEAGASLEEVRKKYADMRKEFESSGNTEGLALIDKLLPAEEMKIRVDSIKKEVNDLFTRQSQQEQSIQSQIQTGLISEIAGRQQLIALHQETGEKIREYLPDLKALSEQPGEAGEAFRGLVAQLESELGNLASTGNELSSAFRDGLQSGIENALIGLAKGTATLSESVKNLALEVVNAMAKIAAQQLAMSATSGLASAFGGAFATGGQVRGAGTTTSDSIPVLLSDKEFVTRAAVVQQRGALPFLSDFNQRGMAAIDDWSNKPRHASGGLAGFPAQIAPDAAPQFASRVPSPASGVMPQIQQTLVLDPNEVMSAALSSVPGQRAMLTFIRANKSTIKQDLN